MTTEIAFYQSRKSSPQAGDNVQALLRGLLQRKGSARGGTAALLKQAHGLIVRAEDTIARQDIRIAALEDIMLTDEISGLCNRRGFFKFFNRELGLCARDHSKGGLLVSIEIDNFNVIKADHGTMAADACIRLLARALESEIRAMDVAARMGTDEFILLLPNTDRKQAAGRVQDLGWRMNNLNLAWYGDIVPVRTGLSLRPYGKGDRIESFFSDAASPRLAKSGLQHCNSKDE